MMQSATTRTTSLMRAIERNYAAPNHQPSIREILVDTYNRERSLDATAVALGVSIWTLSKWFDRFEIELRSTAC